MDLSWVKTRRMLYLASLYVFQEGKGCLLLLKEEETKKKKERERGKGVCADVSKNPILII